MPKNLLSFAILATACAALTPACGNSDGGTGNTAGSTQSSAGANSAGNVGSVGGGSNAGAPASAGNAGAPSGAGGSVPGGGSAGTIGASGSIGSGGTSSGGAGGGSAGSGATGGVPAGPGPHGMSAGCNKDLAGTESLTATNLHHVDISTPLDPVYLGPSGSIYTKNVSGPWNYVHRPYGVKLPKGYDKTKPYAITLGGGGCGGNATNFAGNPSLGYQPDGSGANIQIGLSYLSGCFDDGGPGIDLRTDTPEIPYLRAVIADVEANFCVDLSRVFIGGTSSGGWEAYTGGCGAADVIRAIAPVAGGLRLHRPMCPGPNAAIMVESVNDTENPIGPIVPPSTRTDSSGSGPARDEILKRNGCVAPDFQFVYAADDPNKFSNAPHAVWDAAYPECAIYTGCPKETPVVWCGIGTKDPGCGHQCDNTKTPVVNYKAAIVKFWNSLPSRP